MTSESSICLMQNCLENHQNVAMKHFLAIIIIIYNCEQIDSIICSMAQIFIIILKKLKSVCHSVNVLNVSTCI